LTDPDRTTICGYIAKIVELKCGVGAGRGGLTDAAARVTRSAFVVI
jgi:hypothetical protein